MKTKKRLLSLLLAFCLLIGLMPTMTFAKEPTVSVWDGSSVATAYESGDGTEANPYEITTAEQFAYFAQRISSGYETEAYYVLSCDLDLSAANWTPIGGYPSNIFEGTFDGRGHTIRYAIDSYSPTGPYYSFIGLFECVEGDISNLDVEGSISLSAFDREVSLGGVSGIFDGNITNCESNVDITYASNQEVVWIGGLTGQYRAGTIQECAYTGAISATGNTGEVLAGGICGTLHGGTVDSCKYAGTITCVTADSFAAEAAGGIVGFVITRDSDAMVTVRNCYNEGAVSGSIAGGIIGMVDAYKGEISVENCYSSTMASGTMNQGAVIARSDVGSGTLTVQNCYYLTGEDYYGSKAADLNELYENLSKSGEEGVWIQDTNGVPRLFWEFVVAPEPATFSVTFQDEDGTILDTMSVEEGDDPISLPELKDDDGNRVFIGWWGIDSSGSYLYYAGEKYAVTEDATFIAYWDEIVTLTAPFTTTVELGDSGVPGETVFTLEIIFMGEVDEDMYQDMTISASVTTNGKGDYDGAMTFTGLSQQLKSMLRQGMFVQQVDDGKENWTYGDAVWYLVLADDTEVAAMALSDGVEPEYKILIFQATCEETENGPVYGMDWENTDWDNPEAKMLFTNTYTAHDYTLKHDETEHWDECGCGDVQNREAHQYGEWTVTKESTATESGEKERTCMACGYTETAEIEKLPQYTVTFDTEFGIAPAPKTVTKGTVITLPELEDYGGYAFVGWWILDSSSDFGFYSAGEEYEVSRNVTFVAEWDEIVTLTVPFTTTVELGDSGVPGETVFTLDVVYVASTEEGGEDMYEDVTVSASVTTNGEGDYDGTMTFTGPYRQLQSMLREGVCVQQVDDGKENWTYDDRVWCLILVSDPEVAMLASMYDVEPEDDIEPKYKVLIFQGTCEETENGPVYDLDWENMDWDAPEAKMLFTNIYTAHGYTQKYNETEHWDECGCGDVQNREAHRYGEWTVTKEATETESGKKEHTCTVCGYKETVEIEKLPHIHDYTLKHNETEHWDECGCGDVQNREAHRYGEWTVTKEATETESGEKEHTCTVCGYTEAVEIEKLPHIHDYTLKYNETEHWDECGCGDVQNREAHQYGEWTVTKEATETESGEKEHICTVCGYTEMAEIEKLSHIHDYTLKHNETEHWDECGCGDVQNREAHQYGEWTVTKEATETESGEKEHICTVCGYTETVEIEKLPATKMNLNTGKGTGNTDTDAKSPKTGDNSNIVLWFSLMLVAGAALSGTAVYARKKKRSR